MKKGIKKMKNKNMPIELIMEITELTKEELLERIATLEKIVKGMDVIFHAICTLNPGNSNAKCIVGYERDFVQTAKEKGADLYESAKEKGADLYESAKGKASDVIEKVVPESGEFEFDFDDEDDDFEVEIDY